MENKFQMSLVGKLNYFLGLQVKQTKEGNYVYQTKYANELIKMFEMGKRNSNTNSYKC